MLVRESISFQKTRDPKVALELSNDYEIIMKSILKAKGKENVEKAISEFKKNLTFYFDDTRLYDIHNKRNKMWQDWPSHHPSIYNLKIIKYKTFLKISVTYRNSYGDGTYRYYVTIDLLNPYI